MPCAIHSGDWCHENRTGEYRIFYTENKEFRTYRHVRAWSDEKQYRKPPPEESVAASR